jgi:hypothetical protein
LQWPLEQLWLGQSESEPHEPHCPELHLPLPLQSESEPHEPHMPLEQCPVVQSESEPQWLQLPLLHLPWPWQSESEPHISVASPLPARGGGAAWDTGTPSTTALATDSNTAPIRIREPM